MWAWVSTTNSGTTKTAGTAVTASVTAEVGDVLVVAGAADSVITNPAIPTTAVTDASANTWTNIAVSNNTAAATATKASAGLWVSKIVAGKALTNQNVTFTPHASSPAKAMIVLRFKNGSGTKHTSDSHRTDLVSSETQATVSTPVWGDLMVAVMALEGDFTSEAITFDSDTLQGRWSDGYKNGTTGGVGDTNIAVTVQWKTLDGGGAQTWDASWTTAVDTAVIVGTISPGSAILEPYIVQNKIAAQVARNWRSW